MEEFVKTLYLNHKLGTMWPLVRSCDEDTAWFDEEAMKLVQGGERMSSALDKTVQAHNDLNKLLSDIETRPAESQPECEQARQQYIFSLKKDNARFSAEIRTLEEGIKIVALVLRCKRYKALYSTARRNVCAHKQFKDDHEGRCPYAICNRTGRVLKAKQVANYNRNKPHEVDGGEYSVKFTSRREVHEHGPEDSVHQFCTWECIDADGANPGMDAELKKALDDAYNALDASVAQVLID